MYVLYVNLSECQVGLSHLFCFLLFRRKCVSVTIREIYLSFLFFRRKCVSVTIRDLSIYLYIIVLGWCIVEFFWYGCTVIRFSHHGNILKPSCVKYYYDKMAMVYMFTVKQRTSLVFLSLFTSIQVLFLFSFFILEGKCKFYLSPRFFLVLICRKVCFYIQCVYIIMKCNITRLYVEGNTV